MWLFLILLSFPTNPTMQDIDKLVAMINDPSVDKIPSQNKCAFNGCKVTVGLASVKCSICCFKFCQSHRLPETHDPTVCGSKKKNIVKVEARKAALRKIQQVKKASLTASSSNTKSGKKK